MALSRVDTGNPGLIEAEDIAIAISGSGSSVNVLDGVKLSRVKEATTIDFSGFDGGKLTELVEIAVVVFCHDSAQVQESIASSSM